METLLERLWSGLIILKQKKSWTAYMFNPCQNRISIESVNRYPVGVRPALITGKDDFDEILKKSPNSIQIGEDIWHIDGKYVPYKPLPSVRKKKLEQRYYDRYYTKDKFECSRKEYYPIFNIESGNIEHLDEFVDVNSGTVYAVPYTFRYDWSKASICKRTKMLGIKDEDEYL